MSHADGRVRIYRRQYERYAYTCVLEHNRFGGVMVWAAINHTFKSELVIVNGNLTARQYIDRILQPVVVPMFHQHPGQRFSMIMPVPMWLVLQEPFWRTIMSIHYHLLNIPGIATQ